MVGLDDLQGLVQPTRFYGSMKHGHSSTTSDGVALPRGGDTGLRLRCVGLSRAGAH